MDFNPKRNLLQSNSAARLAGPEPTHQVKRAPQLSSDCSTDSMNSAQVNCALEGGHQVKGKAEI